MVKLGMYEDYLDVFDSDISDLYDCVFEVPAELWERYEAATKELGAIRKALFELSRC